MKVLITELPGRATNVQPRSYTGPVSEEVYEFQEWQSPSRTAYSITHLESGAAPHAYEYRALPHGSLDVMR